GGGWWWLGRFTWDRGGCAGNNPVRPGDAGQGLGRPGVRVSWPVYICRAGPEPDQLQPLPEESSMAESTQLIRGLEGVVAAETELCDLDGARGRLAYRGYDIDDLAPKASFEEVAYLLWMGALPNRTQLDRFRGELTAARPIPPELVKAFALMPRKTDPNRVLQAAVAILGMHDPDANDNSHGANLRKAASLTSQFATAICAHHRVRSRHAPP